MQPHAPARDRTHSGTSGLGSDGASGCSPFEPFVHTAGALDGIVYLPTEDQDEDEELVEYFEQGRISERALQNYRKNSVSRGEDDEAVAEEGSSPSGRWPLLVSMVDRFSPTRATVTARLGLKGSHRRRRLEREVPAAEGGAAGLRDLLTIDSLQDSALNLEPAAGRQAARASKG
jgi:hypothetical protein